SEAHSELAPRISVSESWQRGAQPVFVFSALLSARRFAANNFAIDALNHPDPIGFFRTSVGIEQLVFDGGRQRSATTPAGLRRTIERSTDEAAAMVAVTTTQTFGRVVSAEAARRAADAGLVTAREDLARAERRRDAGMATDADVLSLVVHVADLQQGAIRRRPPTPLRHRPRLLRSVCAAASLRRAAPRRRSHRRHCRLPGVGRALQ